MNSYFHKFSGYSLISGAILMTVTMALHPTGGNFLHIIAVSSMAILVHSIAIFCVPFLGFGFFGLAYRLRGKYPFSFMAFSIVLFGLIAVMLAAMINGLVLPEFLSHYADDLESNKRELEVITTYGFTINHSLDYMFIFSICLSISIWSAIMIRKESLLRWTGFLGVFILLMAIVGLTTGFAFTTLIGFRVFIFSIALWILLAGFIMVRDE